MLLTFSSSAFLNYVLKIKGDKSSSYRKFIKLEFTSEGNVTKTLNTKSAIEINSQRFPATLFCIFFH